MRFGDVESQGEVTPIPLPDDFNITDQAQGDVLYFNGANWVRLAPGTADQSLRTKGAAANPAWENVNNATNLSISGETTGDMLYYNGANWVRLAGGTSGDVLTANGAGVAPTYQTPASGGDANKYYMFNAYEANIASGVYYGCPDTSLLLVSSTTNSSYMGAYVPFNATVKNFRVRFRGSSVSTGSPCRIYGSSAGQIYEVTKTNANSGSWTTATGTTTVSAGETINFYFNTTSGLSSVHIQATVTLEPT